MCFKNNVIHFPSQPALQGRNLIAQGEALCFKAKHALRKSCKGVTRHVAPL